MALSAKARVVGSAPPSPSLYVRMGEREEQTELNYASATIAAAAVAGMLVGMRLLCLSATARRISSRGAVASIEVERKFQLESPTELTAKVTELGGSVLGEIRFRDVYWDTAACALTRRDTWLRQRDGAWELKRPIESDARRSGGERTIFEEVESAGAVGRALTAILPGWTWDETPAGQAATVPASREAADSARLEESLRAAALAPFSTFTTTRARASLDGVAIDADCADFGHSVLELEVMCEDAGDVEAAEVQIERVARLLGAAPLASATGGKLETYIRRYCPGVLLQLIDAGVLHDKAQGSEKL